MPGTMIKDKKAKFRPLLSILLSEVKLLLLIAASLCAKSFSLGPI